MSAGVSEQVGWLYDERARERAYGEWRNFWAVYVEELVRRLGARLVRVRREELESWLKELRALIIPRQISDCLSAQEVEWLEKWARAGGVLVGLAAAGVERLAGAQVQGTVEQENGEFAPSAQLEYVEQVRQLLGLDEEIPSPLFSPIVLVSTCEADVQTIASLQTSDGGRWPAIIWRRLGKGAVGYWAFDLAQTAWVIQQGRPVYVDVDGDGYLRTADAIVLSEEQTRVPHLDLLSFVLRAMLGAAGCIFVDWLPPADGQVADCLLYWGGDEEGAKGTARWASDWMRRRGLPYHVNVMPDERGRFACTTDDAKRIRDNGHELSLHFNFMDGWPHPAPFTEADVRRQVEAFQRAFGFTPVTTVLHWVRWWGWAQPAQWMSNCGIKADNSRLHVRGLNPTNRLGYGFGTSLPYRAWTDWHDGNRRLEFVFQPITAYECGYEREGEVTDFRELDRALAHARRWRLCMNMFYHSVNITWHPACRRAIEHVVEWMQQQGVVARHVGNDELTRWWLAREEIEVWVEEKAGLRRIGVSCPWAEGCMLLVPKGDFMQMLSPAGWARVSVGQGTSVVAAAEDEGG